MPVTTGMEEPKSELTSESSSLQVLNKRMDMNTSDKGENKEQWQKRESRAEPKEIPIFNSELEARKPER